MSIKQSAIQLGKLLKDKGLSLATAESCTGGWIAEAMTAIPGISDCFERGFVSYSDESKQEMLGVHANTLQQFGAVSEQCAREMAEGALRHSHADITISTTGIAGPNGGTPETPVGFVWFAWAGKNFPTAAISQIFSGDRDDIRAAAVEFAFARLLEKLK